MKHNIKTIITSALTALATFFMVVYISCTKDQCKSMVCNNGGTCNKGKCSCATGYEGDNCETSSTSKFIRTWGANNETSSTDEPATFTVSISEGGGATGVTIHNLHNYFTSVNATVSRDSITIPTQTVQGKIVTGAGYIYSTSAYGVNNRISISYTVTDVATSKSISETESWNG